MRGAAALLFCACASAVGAQVSGTASVVSDYRYRGITLSDEKPAAQMGVAYDAPFGAYAGIFASTFRLAPPAGPGIQAMAFAGFASRLASGISIEVGGDYSAFTDAAADNYGEVYLGAASDRLSARIYYAPTYFGRHTNAWYCEINAVQPLFDHIRLLVHAGFLSTRTDYAYGSPLDQHIVDGRIGFDADFDLLHLELAWVGISAANTAYQVTGSRSPNTVVLTLSRQF